MILLYWGAKRRVFGDSREPRRPYKERNSCNASLSNERAQSGDGVLLCLFGNDPHLILPIPSDVLAESKGAGTIEVEFIPEPDTHIATEQANSPSCFAVPHR